MSVLAILAGGLAVFWSCGELDPSQAPGDAVVQIVQAEEGTALTESYSVNATLGVPEPCTSVFRTSLINHCTNSPVSTCDPYTGDELRSCCEANYLELGGDIQDSYRLRMKPGDCGYREIILTAIVSRGAGSEIASTDVLNPYNDMEVRWTTIGMRSSVCGQGVEMWGVNEQRCSPVTPTALAEPFMDKTDGRGMSEIKLIWPIPIYPGSTSTYGAMVDIGVHVAKYTVEISVDDAGEDTGDDDVVDDDA